MKNLWKKPELVVLVRGKPEENVLQTCKGAGVSATSAKKFSGCSRTTTVLCDVVCSLISTT